MDCNKCNNLLSEYIDGYLDDEMKLLVSSHISSCRNCRSLYHSMLTLKKAMESLHPLNVPADFERTWKRRIFNEKTPYKYENESPVVLPRKHRRILPKVIASVATVAAAFVLLALAMNFLNSEIGGGAESPENNVANVDITGQASNNKEAATYNTDEPEGYFEGNTENGPVSEGYTDDNNNETANLDPTIDHSLQNNSDGENNNNGQDTPNEAANGSLVQTGEGQFEATAAVLDNDTVTKLYNEMCESYSDTEIIGALSIDEAMSAEDPVTLQCTVSDIDGYIAMLQQLNIYLSYDGEPSDTESVLTISITVIE